MPFHIMSKASCQCEPNSGQSMNEGEMNAFPVHADDREADFWESISFLVMLITCLMTPLAIMFHNPEYLRSPTGFADGGDMYSHISEALHLKDLLENYTSDLWFHSVSLGYPMFTAYQPLPCFFISTAMIFLKGLFSPLLVFRLVFVAVVSLIPFTFYKSAKLFELKPLQCVFLCLLVFALQSWRKFGLEIVAFTEYGLLTQAFGMLLLPLAVSNFYHWIFNAEDDSRASTLTFIIFAVVFLCNFFFGIYSCILSSVMLFVKFINLSGTVSLMPFMVLVFKFVKVHLCWLFLISWWILSCFVGYKYIGGLPWRTESEDGYSVMFIVNMFINGEFFDSQRFFPWLTIIVLFGFTVNISNLSPWNFCMRSSTMKDRTFSLWLIFSSLVSVVLFLGRTTFSVFYNLIPFHTELETVKYLNAIHFCALLHASTALSEVFSILSETLIHKLSFNHYQEFFFNKDILRKCKIARIFPIAPFFTILKELNDCIKILLPPKRHAMRSAMLIIAALPLWINHFSTIGTQLTMTEVNQNFVNGLKSLRSSTSQGRIFAHKALGTATSWDLAFVPRLTEKPGLMSYSRGYHDSLSIFYLESLAFEPDKAQMFVAMLRLYNVHFLTTSLPELDEYFMELCNMKYIATVDDLVFYEFLHEDPDYGYFDFIRIAGYIEGDLKLIRETVLRTLDLYSINSAVMINPRERWVSNETLAVHVKNVPWWNDWGNFSQQKALVTWSLNDQQNDSQYVIDEIVRGNSWKWIYSQIIEERLKGVEYQAIIQVSDRGDNRNDHEHLLLKVTYHPFWKCFYYPVSDDFSLSMFSYSTFMDGKHYAVINHVTPNMMSVTLPPGRYLVVFTYRFPGILKILALICIIYFVKTLRNLFWGSKEDQTEKECRHIDDDLEKTGKESITEILCENTVSDEQNLKKIVEISSDESAERSSESSEDLCNDIMGAWKIKGRLRSYSITAESRFNTDAVRFLSQNAQSDLKHKIGSYSKQFDDVQEKFQESKELLNFDQPMVMKNASNNDDDVHENIDYAESINNVNLNNHIQRPVLLQQNSSSNLSISSNENNEDKGSRNENGASNDNNEFSSHLVSNRHDSKHDENSSPDSTECPEVARKSLNLQLYDKTESVAGLRDRLQKLIDADRGFHDDQEHNKSAMVKQLRSTYIRQRRNTLSALPTLRK